MRDVGEEGTERHDELDAEIACELAHDLGERSPAVVRLDADHENRVAIGARDTRSEEGVLGPLDAPRLTFVQGDLWASRLKVDEELGIDVRELVRLPEASEVAGCERRSLPAVVPATERADQDGAFERGPLVQPQLLGHGTQLTVEPVDEVVARGRMRSRP